VSLPPRGLLVGFGSIGRRHLTNLHGLGVEDWAVVHTGTGTLAFEPPGPVRVHPSLEAALARERPDFAVVANPTALHLPTALACVEHGCDVLLEKPVSHSLAGIDALVDAAAHHDRRVLVGFQFRFDPALARIIELLRGGAVGTPLHADVTWGEYLPDWHPWEDYRTGYAARPELGGGVHHTICHPLDYLRACFGEPAELRASLSRLHPLGLEVAEACDVRVRFDAGVEVGVHLDYWARPRVHRFEITGSEGAIVWDFIGAQLRWWTTGDDEWRAEPTPGVDGRDALFVAEAAHFLDVVARRAAPRCTLDDGIRAVRMAAAIERSDAADGAAVPRPADPPVSAWSEGP
jgi:predicted dehydrogenase